MLLFTTLLFSAAALAQVQPGTACDTELYCSSSCFDGQYIYISTADGFVCDLAVTDEIYYVSAYCAVNRYPDNHSIVDVCNKYGGTLCELNEPNTVNACVVGATSAQVLDVEKAFQNCGGEPNVYASKDDASKYCERY